MMHPTGPHHEMKEYPAGHQLIREGQLGPGLYVLMSGTLEVLRGDVHITDITMKGAFVSEISAILGCRCTATVRTKTPSRLMLIERVTPYLEANPKSAILIAQTLAARIMEMNDKFVELQKQFSDWAGLEDRELDRGTMLTVLRRSIDEVRNMVAHKSTPGTPENESPAES